MKKAKWLGLILVFVMVFSVVIPSPMHAAAIEDTRTWYYPVLPGDETWKSMSYEEALKACTMPAELLDKCSTDELADLVLDYPFLVDIVTFGTIKEGLEMTLGKSNICMALITRDDAIDILLNKYDNLNVDYGILVDPNAEESDLLSEGWVFLQEQFLIYYFGVNIYSLDEGQILKLKEIVGEKYELKKEICNDLNRAYSIFFVVQETYGEVSRDLIPDNIYADMVDEKYKGINLSDGWSPDPDWPNLYYANSSAAYRIGWYDKYGIELDCLQFYLYDWDVYQKAIQDSLFMNAHPSWDYVSTCSQKYNCHSYAWITTSTSNIWWLDSDPTTWANTLYWSYYGWCCDAPGSATLNWTEKIES